jgi:putative FmdB family regulatory protein
MPIYEYVCDDCGQRYERIVLSQTQNVTCPSSRKTTFLLGPQVQPAPVQLSVFSAHSGSSANAASADAASCDAPGSCACGLGGCGRN